MRWDELEAAAPARIPLVAATAASSDDCPSLLDAALLAPGGCVAPGCSLGVDAQGRRVAFVMEGPDGSGRFSTLGVVVGDTTPRVACVGASTVAWRHLHRVSKLLAPLTWFGDLDGNGTAELVAWQRLPWGDSEATNAMVPIAYAIEGDALVRRDVLARGLAKKTAAAFEQLVTLSAADGSREDSPTQCYRAAAAALSSFAGG